MTTFVRTQEVEHEIGAAGSFALRVTDAEVQLRAVDGPTARVRATFEVRAESDAEADAVLERVQLRVVESAGALELSEPREGPPTGLGALARMLRIGADALELRVEADLPRDTEIRFSGVSGDVTATELTGTQHYRTVSGDVVLTDVGGELSAQAVSGDLSIRAEREIGLEVSTVSGDASVIAPRFARVRANTISGDLELEGELSSGVEHRIDTVSGDVAIGLVGDLTLEVRGLSTDVDCTLPHRSEGSRDRRRYVIGDGRPTLTFSSMSGDISIAAPRRGPARNVPTPPAPPRPPRPPDAATLPADEQLAILRALERGEIDVDEAARRLAPERGDD